MEGADAASYLLTPPPEGMLGYCTSARAAGSTKRREKFGSSVACKTIGTFLSKERHRDASAQATERTKAEAMQRTVIATAKRQLPDPTANYLLSSLIGGNAATPPLPLGQWSGGV